jgi:Co/Zn/Cd efflux system component
MPALFQSLYQGHHAQHTVGWKYAGVATAGITSLLSLLSGIAVVSGWIPQEIPPETIMAASSFIVSAIAGLLGYVTVATTDKIGLPDSDQGDCLE